MTVFSFGFLSAITVNVKKKFNVISSRRNKFYRNSKYYRFSVISIPVLVIFIILILSSLIIWTGLGDESDEQHLHQFQNRISSYNRTKYEHHTMLESHRLQMMLSRSSSSRELHQIMSKQSNVLLNNDDISDEKEEIPFKKILYWPPISYAMIKAFPEPFGLGVGRDVYRRAGCPVWQCETSQDRSNLSQYDAIFFHYIPFSGWDLPKTRFPEQRYVFFETEPQTFNRSDRGFFVPEMMNDFFNWTMTFRWDSDVVHPYGWIEPNGSIPLHPTEEEYQRLIAEPLEVNYAEGKTKMAAWMVTNCDSASGRSNLVKQLIDHGIQVDVYGRCGNLTCGIYEYHEDGKSKTDETDEPCREMISKKYKFYFALENALCIDYVTEKFYSMMRYPIVLVVMDAHGNHARAAPPHSYINALDFPSTRALADYLIKLDGDDNLYNEYF